MSQSFYNLYVQNIQTKGLDLFILINLSGLFLFKNNTFCAFVQKTTGFFG
jgi:hypothetical protein